jgi:hypothetical protein
MLIDGSDYPIENPKYYLVVLNSEGDVKELIFTRKDILKYLHENSTGENVIRIPKDSR